VLNGQALAAKLAGDADLRGHADRLGDGGLKQVQMRGIEISSESFLWGLIHSAREHD
jgi:hypothetical protein